MALGKFIKDKSKSETDQKKPAGGSGNVQVCPKCKKQFTKTSRVCPYCRTPLN